MVLTDNFAQARFLKRIKCY